MKMIHYIISGVRRAAMNPGHDVMRQGKPAIIGPPSINPLSSLGERAQGRSERAAFAFNIGK
jgi:hypothetical protein